MTFYNDPEKRTLCLKRAYGRTSVRAIILLAMANFIWFVIKGIEYTNLMLLINNGVLVLTIVFILLWSYKSAVHEYDSLKIECSADSIELIGKGQYKKIKLNEITRITRDSKGNFYISTANKFNRMIIARYLEDIDLFEDFFKNICEIKSHQEKIRYLQYIPGVLFIGSRVQCRSATKR